MPILLLAFAGVGLVNLCFYFAFFKFSFSKEEGTRTNNPFPVSVVICAKNEAENLRNFVPYILGQNHPNFELVLINDASTDDTLEVIEAFRAQDPRVQIVNVKNNEAFWANKKYALTLGIKKAKYPYLLFTDADCRPQSGEWISGMASHFSRSKSIVLGYGGYFIKKGSFLNKLIRFETLFTAIQYFSYAAWGNPYMGVGRNLAYTSAQFYEQNGFADHLHVKSGDDDLFVNQAATGQNTAICTEKTTITRSLPKSNFKDWFRQKRRHVSVARHYKLKHRLLLGFFYSSQLLFWILLVICLFGNFWKIVLGLLIFRILIQGLVFYKASRKLNEPGLWWCFPFLEAFLISSQFGIFISNIFSKPSPWK
ncbi:MAG TPA: glycosyltransferase [Salinimicrobium sp.]|nr:glycosyltransferase [Salinimicrobium sp.]